MDSIIIDIINQYGYLGIGFLVAVENIFPPIPSEVILTFGGFLTTFTNMNLWGVIIAATIGSVIGAIVLYLIGRLLNTDRLERLIDSKLGKALHLDKNDVNRAVSWFRKHDKRAVFICRFIPVIRSLISIPAGIEKMKFSVFFPLTVIGTFIWNIVLVLLGRLAGDAWQTIASYVDTYSMIASAGLLLAFIVALYIFIKKRFLKKKGV